MKKVMLICAPVTSRSGYGAHARDLVKSLMENDNLDIKIMDVSWGNTPKTGLDADNSEDKKMLDCFLTQPQMDQQPDIYVDIRIPNEFAQWGKYNIGITAGIETTAVSQAWINGVNKMDLTIVPSEHSKRGFVSSVWDKLQQMPDGSQQKLGVVKMEKPMEVVFEGSDEEIYKPIENVSLDLVDDIPEDFAFLSVGQWGKGGYGEDRKDLGKTIKTFYESFANKEKQPALILKTNGATYSIMDREDCLKKINLVKNMFPKDWKLPNVYLLHGSFTDEEMNKLYNHPKVKCMYSLTHGEGYGRPLQEATMVGLPVIASNWSGHVDFLDSEYCVLLGGELKQVPKSVVWKDIIVPEGQWFNVDDLQATKSLQYTFENYDEFKNKALKLMDKNRKNLTLKNMSIKLNELIDKVSSEIPTQVAVQLPKLQKVSEDKNTIKLPKLKKVEETNHEYSQ